MNLMGRDAKAANRAQMNRQAKARNGHASRESAGRTPPLGAAAKPGSMVCMTCGLPEQGAVHHADIRALEARVKELEAALREAKRAMDSYAPKGEPSLRGRYDTRAQAMVDAALRGKP